MGAAGLTGLEVKALRLPAHKVAAKIAEQLTRGASTRLLITLL